MSEENPPNFHNAFFTAVQSTPDDAIIELTLDGTVLNWNRGAENLFGYSFQEIANHNVRDLLTESSSRLIPSVLSKVETGETVSKIEITTVRRNQDQFYALLTLLPIYGYEGKVSGCAAFIRDVTEYRNALELVRIQREQLLHLDKVKSLGVLVSAVAHEINNPNNLIMLNTGIVANIWDELSRIIDESLPTSEISLIGLPYTEVKSELGNLIQGISQGASRIAVIVKRLKDFVRQSDSLNNEIININDVVQSAVQIVNNLIKQETDNLRVQLNEPMLPVKGNAQQIEQVIINLLTNACQSLTSRREAISIETRSDMHVGNITIIVEDEGEGISPEHIKRIYEPFFTTRKDKGGTGLGLSISREIINTHRGEILFKSQPGKGTRVTIVLPAFME